MGNFVLPTWMQSFVHPDAPAAELDPADLGTVLGLEMSLMPEAPSPAPRLKKPAVERVTDFGDLPRD